MTDFKSLLPELLGAVYGHVDGYPMVTFGGEVSDVQAASDLSDRCASKNDHGHLILVTDQDEVVGIRLAFSDLNHAYDVADRIEPSLVIKGSHESVHLIYLLSTGSIKDIEDLLDDLNVGDKEDFYADDEVPLPYGPYELSADDVTALEAGEDLAIYTLKEFEDALFEVPSEAPAREWEWNDATVYGDIPDEIRNLPMKISIGSSQEEKKWKSVEATFGQWLEHYLTKHTIGKKNGSCFVTGDVIEGKRSKNSMRGMYALGIDVDSGASMDDAFEVVRGLGLFAVFYTTHSHLATEITIKQNPFFQWCEKEEIDTEPTTDSIRAYLRKEGKYDASVIDSAEFEETVHDSTGIHHIVRTKPIEKFRVIFPLIEPYEFAKQNMAQRDSILQWERMVAGMGAALGVQIDRSARDPSRLFFYPRHPKGGVHRTLINSGNLLDWEKITQVDPKQRLSSDPFERAADILGGRLKGRPMSPTKGLDLMTWAAERADGFEIGEVIKDYCSDRIRQEISPGKYACECPFDENHSNAGDPEDVGFYILDSSAGEGFVAHCQHDSCADKDRLQMLEKMMIDDWFTDDVLTDPKYDCIDRGETEEVVDEETGEVEEKKKHKDTVAAYDKAMKLIEKVTPDSATADIEEILQLCVGLADFDRNRVFTALAKAVKLSQTAIAGLFKRHMDGDSSMVDDEIYDPEKEAKKIKAKFASLKRSKKPIVIINDIFETPTISHCVKVISELNVGRPEEKKQTREGVEIIPAIEGLFLLLNYGDNAIRIIRTDDGIRTEALSKPVIKSFAHHNMNVVRMADTAPEPVTLPDWCAELIVVDPHLKLPQMDGFNAMPYFNKYRELVSSPGFNYRSRRYLKMSPEIEEILSREGLINEDPTYEEMIAARDEILYVFHDFPFYDGADMPDGHSSRAHLFAMMIQPIVREMINGPTPIYLVDKPSAGTGASLLVTTAMTIATGEDPDTQTMPDNDEEIRKGISGAYFSGRSYIFYDNINYKLTSGFIANLATAKKWQDRMLGKSEVTSVPNTMQVIFAGNNVAASEENMRRMLLIKLDFRDDPTSAERKFQIEDINGYVDEHKIDLFAALLTMVNYWIKQGAPMWDGKPLAGFDDYCRVMGGILETCEVYGFLDNRELSASANSSDRLAWNQFIQELITKIGMNKWESLHAFVQTYCFMADQPYLHVNGGGKVVPSDDEGRVYGPMQIIITKQLNQVFKVYVNHKEIKVTIQRRVHPETQVQEYAIIPIENVEKAA